MTRIRLWSLRLTLDGHPIGELVDMTDTDVRQARAALRKLFGGRLRSATVETWLRTAETSQPPPLRQARPARPRLKKLTRSPVDD